LFYLLHTCYTPFTHKPENIALFCRKTYNVVVFDFLIYWRIYERNNNVKKFLLILFFLILICVIGLSIFIVTFDANRFRPMIIERLETILGSKVDINKISLTWHNGIALVIDKLAIYSKDKNLEAPDISLEKAYAVIELAPLLQKNIKFASISLDKPLLSIVKNPTGNIVIQGINPQQSEAPTLKESETSTGKDDASFLSFFIKTLRVKDGKISFTDQTKQPSIDIIVNDFDATLRNVSLSGPFMIEAQMSVFSNSQNIKLLGTLSGLSTNVPVLKDFDADIDIGATKQNQLMQAIPALRSAGLRQGTSGNLHIHLDILELRPEGIENFSGEIQLKDGQFALSQLYAPIEKIDIDASMDLNEFNLKGFSASIAGASIAAKGTATNLQANPNLKISIASKIPKLSNLITALMATRPKIDGSLTFSFDGTATGLTWPSISSTLSGEGTFSLQRGVLLDINLTRLAIEKTSMIPGMAETVLNYLPAPVKNTLDQPYTLLDPIHKSFIMHNGNVSLNNLVINADYWTAETSAQLSLSGYISGHGLFRFQRVISNAMISGFEQIRSICNEDNMIEFPISYHMANGRFTFLPDIEYITSRLTAASSQEILSGLLQQTTGTPGGSGGEASGSSSSPTQGLLGEILKRAVEN